MTNTDPTCTDVPAQTPVLIVGAGPSGLLAAILLARYGIRSTVLERHSERLRQPKAHAINPRSLEILKQAGFDTCRLRELGASTTDADAVRFSVSMAGLEFGSLPYERQDDAVKTITPEPLFNIAQPLIEEQLLKALMETGMVTIHHGWQWNSCVETEEKGAITSTVLNRRTNCTTTIVSKYLLGCDGAHARSREGLEIPFEVLDGKPAVPHHYCSVHIKADLSHMKTGTLWFIVSRSATRIFIAYDRKETWVFVMTYDPNLTPAETFTHDYCCAEIDVCIGAHVDYKVQSIVLWSTTPRIAKYYQSRKIPNAFLAGDAAHSFPSTGGLGVNTGIADVHNLAWKIHAVEKGWHPASLLDSYGRERRPVAVANSRQSASNENKIHRLIDAIHGGCGDAEHRMHDTSSRRQILDAIKDNADHFDSLNLQIGYIYGQEASPPSVNATRRSCRDYRPECIPGARLPHALVERRGQTQSTLDLVDGHSYVLLTSLDFENAGGDTEIAHRIPVTVLTVGHHFTDLEGEWTELMGLNNARSAVLVRPDQHIMGKLRGSAAQLLELLKSLE